MYLFNPGLGEVFRPRPRTPAKLPPKAPAKPLKEGWVTKDDHRRYCGPPSGGEAHCDLNLRVRFRTSFEGFVREVENAYGRWMAGPTAQGLVKRLQKPLKEWHQEMLYRKVLENDPLVLVAGLHYRRSDGSWLVTRSDLRQWNRLIDL